MKKNLLIGAILVAFLMMTGMASASVYPRIVPVRYHPGYYDDYGYRYYGEREWVPGHWETVRRYHHWRRVWIPGHWVSEPWEYRY